MIEMLKREVTYGKPSYVECRVFDLTTVSTMRLRSYAIHGNFADTYNLIYSDIDSLVYDIRVWIFNSGFPA